MVRLCLTADLETETMARLVPTNLGWHQHTVPCFFSLGGSARPEKLRCGFSECGHARGRVLYVVLARTSDRASVRFFLLARARQKFLDEPTHFFGGPREKTGEFSVRGTPLFWGHFQNNPRRGHRHLTVFVSLTAASSGIQDHNRHKNFNSRPPARVGFLCAFVCRLSCVAPSY